MSVNDETLRLARALRVTIDTEVDAATRRIVKAWATAWDEIHGTWSEAMMDLAAGSTEGRWPDPWLVARSERAQRALAAATDQIVELANLTGVTVTDGVGKVVQATPPFEVEIMASQLPPAVRADAAVRFNRLDELQMSAIVRRTAEDITSATRMLALRGQDAMRRALVTGIAVGDNPRRVARETVRRAEGAFNGGLTRALTIARTEMLDAHRLAAMGVHVGNEDLVAGWVWLAQLDTRTCPSCWALHGTEHDIAEPGPQDHHQGRCGRLPVLKPWSALGFDIAEPPSVVPDARAVFDALPQADRLAVMGPARLQALDDGAIGFLDLASRRSTSGWRDAWVPTPARDLLRRAG